MRKGQAAMEFLMTYGWAILVVLAAIGALAYFGVLSPDRFLPDKCTANPPFACTEYKVDADAADGAKLYFVLQNSAGVGVTYSSVELYCDSDASTPGTGIISGNSSPLIQNGASVDLNFSDAELATANCDGFNEGDKVRGDFDITFVRSGESVEHTGSGSIQVRAE